MNFKKLAILGCLACANPINFGVVENGYCMENDEQSPQIVTFESQYFDGLKFDVNQWQAGALSDIEQCMQAAITSAEQQHNGIAVKKGENNNTDFSALCANNQTMINYVKTVTENIDKFLVFNEQGIDSFITTLKFNNIWGSINNYLPNKLIVSSCTSENNSVYVVCFEADDLMQKVGLNNSFALGGNSITVLDVKKTLIDQQISTCLLKLDQEMDDEEVLSKVAGATTIASKKTLLRTLQGKLKQKQNMRIDGFGQDLLKITKELKEIMSGIDVKSGAQGLNENAVRDIVNAATQNMSKDINQLSSQVNDLSNNINSISNNIGTINTNIDRVDREYTSFSNSYQQLNNKTQQIEAEIKKLQGNKPTGQPVVATSIQQPPVQQQSMVINNSKSSIPSSRPPLTQTGIYSSSMRFNNNTGRGPSLRPGMSNNLRTNNYSTVGRPLGNNKPTSNFVVVP